MSPSVLHVTQCTDAGVPHVVVGQLAAARAAGWRVALATPGGDMADLGREAGAEVHTWLAERSPVSPTLRAEVRDLRAVVNDVRPDAVVLHSAKAGLVGRIVVRGAAPTVFVPHAWSWQAASGAQRSGALAWERYAARWTDVFACVSEGEAAEGRRHGVRGSYAIVPNDVDAAAVRAAAPGPRAAARIRLGLEARRPVAVCVARLAPQKDHGTLLRAWSRVAAANPAARLYLVGDGPDAPDVARTAATIPGVVLVGAVDRCTPLTWMSAADVVVCSSRFEGRALVPQEAAALGRVVVTTDVEGTDEGYVGPARVVVPVGDDASLAAATARLLTDAAAREHAERHLVATPPPAPSGDRMIALLEDLVGRGVPSPVTAGEDAA
jgi:glycosyltransferase involved in cell wall biosynthesis